MSRSHDRRLEMEKITINSGPTSNKSKKLQWDARFADGLFTKQQLPLRQKFISMNGSVVKSSLSHLGVKSKKQPFITKNGRNEKKECVKEGLTVDALTDSDRDRERGREEGKMHDDKDSKTRKVRRSVKDPKSALGLRNISFQSEPLNTEIEISDSKNRNDEEYYDSDVYENDDDISIDSNNHHNGYNDSSDNRKFSTKTVLLSSEKLLSPSQNIPSLSKLSSLEIEVSESIQTMDKEDYEMKKEIYEMSTMNLNNNSKRAPKVNTLFGVKKTFPFWDDLEGSSGGPSDLPSVLCRLEFLGRGSSAVVYKSVILKSLTLCAEKVIFYLKY